MGFDSGRTGKPENAGTDLAAKDLPPAEKCVGAPSFKYPGASDSMNFIYFKYKLIEIILYNLNSPKKEKGW